MLTNILNTNEVKNSAATEVEFQSMSMELRTRIYSAIAESPALPHRLSIKHSEVGNGIKQRRRSVIRVDKTIVSTIDNVTPVTISAYVVLDAPVGALATSAEMVNVLAELGSFSYLTGAGTTLLFDGSGNGCQALLTGGI